MATRRQFLLTVGTATASLAAPGFSAPLPVDGNGTSAAGGQDRSRRNNAGEPDRGAAGESIQFPRVFAGQRLSRISFPLGGIGTGGIGLGGRGNLMDWEIFNRPETGHTPAYAFPAIWAKVGDDAPASRVLERRILPPYDLRPDNLGSANVPGLPRFAEAAFHGSFPTARIDFHDPKFPLQVTLDAHSSFQPIDVDISGLPFAMLQYTVQNPHRRAAQAVIAWSIENPVGDGDRRRNDISASAGIQGLLMTNPSLPETDALKGSFVVAALEEADGKVSVLPNWNDPGWNMGVQRFWFDAFSRSGDLGETSEPHSSIGSVAVRQAIPPGESRTFRFLLSWHFPNRTSARCGWEAPKGEENALLGNYYCTRFDDAWAVATYVARNLTEIESGTSGFLSALQSSTLPAAVVEAATANLPTLVSNTSFRIADGSFHGFEGCGERTGWGHGTCTHVWNYEVATQFLFPFLARSMRDTSFGYATDENGRMDFRHKLPLGKEHWNAAAADGQMGQIVKLYLDWKMNADQAWLRKLWPACKRALAYAWRAGGWDANGDGVMEGAQHNTYDVEFYGPNPLCETWYLAALRACEEMAAALNDTGFAVQCRNMFRAGSRWTDANLFNGEYYVQQVRGIPADQIADGLRIGMGAKDTLHPIFQAGSGCLIDQLLGQFIADLAGLGPLLDESRMRSALASIYKYNSRQSMDDEPSVERVFSVNDERALVMCDYTGSERPDIPFPYYSENFTGSEYAAAILMLKHGMIREGIECIANIRARYDGEKANPYSEAEYGRHYARAMASWGAIPILSGFAYDGPRRELTLKPLIHEESFRCFWSTPAAWGVFEQEAGKDRSTLRIKPSRGSIAIESLKLDSRIFPPVSAEIAVGDRSTACRGEGDAKGTTFVLAQAAQVTPEVPLSLTLVHR